MARLRSPVCLFAAGALLAACSGDVPPTDPLPEGCAAIRVEAASHPIAPTVLEARREALFDSLQVGLAIFAAGWAMGNAEGDPERQNSEFYYLTGLAHVEHGWLVLVAETDGSQEVRLYLPAGPTTPAGELASDVTGELDVRCIEDAYDELVALLRREEFDAPRVSFAGQADDALLGLLGDAGIADWRTTHRMTTALRQVKHADEIALLREAAQLSAAAIALGMRAAGPGLNEADVEAAIENHFSASGAIRRAFPSIVAAGENALEIHYFDNDEPLADGDLIVVDVGIEHGRYAGDVARTFPVSGVFTERQAELYELVLGALRAGIEEAGPGSTRLAIEDAILASLNQAGDLCHPEIPCDYFMIHSGGHHVGLDVHDPSFAINALEPGAILNVEPGIYLEHEGIGIRLEETIRITASGNGAEVLSTGAPLEIADIEALMAE